MAYSDVVLADSPLMYLKMDSASGNIVNHGSLGGNGIVVGTPQRGVAGIPGSSDNKAFNFVLPYGSNYVYFNMSGAPFSDRNFAIEIWAKLTDTDAGLVGSSFGWWLSTNNPDGFPWSDGMGGGSIYSSHSITDGEWHHVVFNVKTTGREIWVDGVKRATAPAPTSHPSTSGMLIIGSESTVYGTEGILDEAAAYPSALSDERIIAHYNAGIGTPLNASFTATPATGAGTAPDAKYVKSITSMVTADARIGANPDGSATFHLVGPGIDDDAMAVKAPINLPAEATVYRAFLHFRGGGNTATASARKITSDWTESDTSSVTFDVTALGSKSIASSGWHSVEITGAVVGWNNGDPNYGIRLTSAANKNTISTRESENYKPYITVEYIASPNIYVDASPAAGSGLMTDAEFSNPLIVNAEPAEGSALVVDPVVVGEGLPDVTVVAEPGYSMSEMPGGGYSEPIAVEVLFAEGSGEVVEVTVDTTFNALITPEPFESESYLFDPDEARRDIDDPYFRRIVATTDDDDIWFRLDEKEGLDVIERVGGSGAVKEGGLAKWNIAPQFNINGPVGRRAVRLDGRQYIDRSVWTAGNPLQNTIGNAGEEYTFETVIRTTQKDFLLFSAHDVGDRTYNNRLWVKDGKITLIGPPASVNSSTASEVSGFKDIADGQWHHIVVTYDAKGPENDLNNGLRIYIDGQLDIRRRELGGKIFATPDHWFGAPTGMRNWLNLPPNFIGDVMEMTYRYRMDLGRYDIQRLYYDAMGIIPIEIAPFRGTGESIDAKGRGNVKRALMLYFNTSRPYDAGRDTRESAMGLDVLKGDFDFGAQIPTPGSPGWYDSSIGAVNEFRNAGYHFFFASVDSAPHGDWYRDPVTDLPRLADVDKDFDLSSFDLIMYKNWPDDGNEFDRLTMHGFAPDALDKHVESLRRAIDETGISLWVSNPSLGVRLGIISTAEFISRLRESKFHPNQGLNQYGNWNDHAPVVHPFGRNMAPWSARDTHMNNRERVVATVEGMTDLPGYVIDDAVIWSIFDPMEGLEQDWSLRFNQRLDGLQIGDEYVEPTYWRAEVGRNTDRHVDGGNQYLYGMYAVPASAVLAGTAVTKLGRTHWVEGNKEVPNPYADYVGTIVLQPGDTLKGTPVQSKILFTVGQDPRYATHDGIDDYSIQVVPEDKEPEYMRRWHFSTARWLVGGGGGNVDQGPGAGGGVVAVPNADGTFTFVTGGNKTTWANLIIHENYPRIPIKVPNMVLRGMKWLGDRIVDSPGDSTVRVTPLAGSAEVPEPSVNANRMVRVNVPGPALANGQMKAPEGYSGDMLVLVFPALGSASMTNYVRLIEAAPATGDGVMPDPGEVQAKSDSITLFLNSKDSIILYLEEL